MQRLSSSLAVVLCSASAIVLLAGPAASVDAPPYATDSGVDVVSGLVSRGVVPSGQTVTFTGRGFGPQSVVRLSTEGVPGATLRADRAGVVVVTLRPRGPEGTQAVAATGTRASGETLIVSATIRIVRGGVGTADADRPTADLSSGLALLAGFGLVASTVGVRLAVLLWRAAPSRKTA